MPELARRPPEIRVLIADDHAIVRDGLRLMVESDPGLRVAGQAVDGLSTLARLRDTPCDVLLLDLDMPEPSGPGLVSMIHGQWPDLPVLMLSMHSRPAAVRATLQAGASGYVLKDSNPEVLLYALRQVVAGGFYLEPQLARALAFTPPPRPRPRLTPRESEVLHRLVGGATNAEIARSLYLSSKTVSTHKANLMTKLGLSSMTDLIRFVDEQREMGVAGFIGSAPP